MPRSKKLTKNNNLLIPKDKLKSFLDSCLDTMKSKQDKMLNTHNFGRKSNKFIFFPNYKKFYMYDEKTNNAFFEAQYQIVGTYSPKSETWRFGWSNRHVPHDLKKSSLKLKEFGESNGLEIFTLPKVRDDKLGMVFTAIAMKLSNAKGYYIVPAEGNFPEVHLIFTKVKKINRSIDKVKADFGKKNTKKRLRYTKLI